MTGRAKKHNLVVIGWLGVRQAYLDMSKEEAIALYREEHPGADITEHVSEFAFDDVFGVYDAWSIDKEENEDE